MTNKNILPHETFAKYFSAYSPHPIEKNGVVYPTVEHAYHCARYNDQKVIDEIRSAPTPEKAWEISQRYKHLQLPDFNERKLAVMKELFRAKLAQHEEVRRALFDSGDLLIVKHVTGGPPVDGFWDDGEDGTGQNIVGKLWMQLREELFQQANS